jgi:hypothetical protein
MIATMPIVRTNKLHARVQTERRTDASHTCVVPVLCYCVGGRSFFALAVNLSVSGARLHLTEDIPPLSSVQFLDTNSQPIVVKARENYVQVYKKRCAIGCTLDPPLSDEQLARLL